MRHSRLTTIAMVAPLALLLLLFVFGLAQSVAAGFGYIPQLGMYTPTFDYYREVFTAHNVPASIALSLYISLASSVIAVVLGVLVALALSSSGWLDSRAMQLFKLPIIVPHTVCALLLLNLLSQNGFIARLLYSTGIIADQQDFFSFFYNPGSLGVILAFVWKEAPFALLVVLTIMVNINSGLGQAACNLGASKARSFFSVTLPLCAPAISTAFIIIFAYSFSAYELPFLLGATDPKALPVQTYVEFVYPDLAHRPYTMVLNTVMIAVTLIFSYAYYRIQGILSGRRSQQ